jgi:SRSO17 transposase
MEVNDKVIQTVDNLELVLQDVSELMTPLKEYHAIYAPLFGRREHHEHSEFYVKGLLSPEVERKSIEPMVLHLKGADGNAVRAVQQFLGEGSWKDDPIRRRHWTEVETTLGEDDGVLMVDGSDFPKQGKHSAGVKRQYCGQLGKRANCQAGVFAGYTSSKGYTLLDTRLYIPEVWFSEAYAFRRKKCRIPEHVRFQTKNELACEMIEAITGEGTLRFRWVTGDEAFGCDTWLLDQINGLGCWYFMEVPINTQVWMHRPETAIPPWCGRGCKPKVPRLLEGEPPPDRVDTIAQSLPTDCWSRHTIKEGTKGPIVADFAAFRVNNVRNALPGSEVWLILRRDVMTGEVKFYLSNAPAETELTTLVRISGMRWPIEICFEDGKQMLGMGDYEVRSWIGWNHHMTLCLLAHHFLVRLQREFKKNSEFDPAPSPAAIDCDPTQANGGLSGCYRFTGLSDHPQRNGISKPPTQKAKNLSWIG